MEAFTAFPSHNSHMVSPAYSQVMVGGSSSYSIRSVIKRGGWEGIFKVKSRAEKPYIARIHKIQSVAFAYVDTLGHLRNEVTDEESGSQTRAAYPGLECLIDYGTVKLPGCEALAHFIISPIHDGSALDWITTGPGVRLASSIRPRVNLLFTHQLYSAMIYLQERGLAHNDIKAENVMIAQSKGQIIVVDFIAATTLPDHPETNRLACVARQAALDSDAFAATEVLIQLYLGRKMDGGGEAGLQAVTQYLRDERQCATAVTVAKAAYEEFRPGRGYASPILRLSKYPENYPEAWGVSDVVSADHFAAMQFLLDREFLAPALCGIPVANELRDIFKAGYLLEANFGRLAPRMVQLMDRLNVQAPMSEQQTEEAKEAIRVTT
eukprot:scpid82900/ scgid7619/ 